MGRDSPLSIKKNKDSLYEKRTLGKAVTPHFERLELNYALPS